MFQCYYEGCGNTYKTRFNLRRHINSNHLKIKGFTCPECNKPFVSKQNLKEHNYIHTGEKPFPCDEPGCLKRFRQASQLSIHKRTHYKLRNAKGVLEFPRFGLELFSKIFENQFEDTGNVKLSAELPKFKEGLKGMAKLPVIPCLLTMKKLLI